MIQLFEYEKETNIHTALQIIAILIEYATLFPFIFFLVFHLDLITSNTTTLEQMDQKRAVNHNQHAKMYN